MDSAYSSGPFRQPPMFRSNSSSSSLYRMERVAPSFQEFVKRTPPLEAAKPLPPVPLVPRRASSTSPLRSSTPSLYALRRSSSVYSRTVSQWAGDGYSWNTSDFADEPLPPLPRLQPIACSASTPQPGETLGPSGLLKPRAYSPLIMTPSPTDSPGSIHSSPARQPLSDQVPAPPQTPSKKKTVQMVSLEQANAAIHAPGAVHLLPEELRAKTTIGRSRSHDPLRLGSVDMFNGNADAEAQGLSELPSLMDLQGRRRTLLSPSSPRGPRQTGTMTEYPFPILSSSQGSPAGSNSHRPSETAYTPRLVPLRPPSPDHFRPLAGIPPTPRANVNPSGSSRIDEIEEGFRGRPRHRGLRPVQHSQRMIPEDDSPYDSERPGARNVAEPYHMLVADTATSRSRSAETTGTTSDQSVSNHMKMVPKPLFMSKPPAKLPGTMGGPMARQPSYESNRRRGESSGSSRRSRPFGLSLSPSSSHRRRSTSGSTPISPPVNLSASGQAAVPTRKYSSVRQPGRDTRESACYPYVGPRKRSRSKTKRTQKASHSPSSLFKTTNWQSNSDIRRKSSTSEKAKQSVLQKLAKEAAKYADLLTAPSEVPTKQYAPITAATIASGSPHLLPSPIKAASTQVHLGWMDKAKTAFDGARSSVQSSRKILVHSRIPARLQYIHVVTPARPLDETQAGLREPATPKRKNSIFGGVLDGWKESKAEREREELKKVIKVVPNSSTGTGVVGLGRRASAFGWM